MPGRTDDERGVVRKRLAGMAGILILVRPSLLNYIVAIYLILIGLLELMGNSGVRL